MRIARRLVPDQYSIPLPAGIKQIACIHDLMHRYESRFPEVGEPFEYAGREERYRRIIERCAGILVDSETGKQHVLDCYEADPSRIFILPYVVYNGLKKASPERPPALPQGVEDKYIYYPAQFWLHKNHRNLLEAVARLRPELDIACVFSGDIHKNWYASFLACVERLGLKENIHCLGYVSEGELAWLYQHARCLVMPTFFGPTNIPPLEAMHFGCPVGVSGIYGIPEQLGEAAVYFDPDSVEDMMRVIRRLWTDESLRAINIQKGYSVARAHSAEQFSAGLGRIIHQLSG